MTSATLSASAAAASSSPATTAALAATKEPVRVPVLDCAERAGLQIEQRDAPPYTVMEPQAVLTRIGVSRQRGGERDQKRTVAPPPKLFDEEGGCPVTGTPLCCRLAVGEGGHWQVWLKK